MSYHQKPIQKGTLGEFSKIREEFQELEDAIEQESPILQLCELADMIGAIEAYSNKKWNIPLTDLLKMMESTKSAFKDGTRR
jgi:hypothetical protein